MTDSSQQRIVIPAVGMTASLFNKLNNNNNKVTKCKYNRVQEIDPPAVPPVAILRLPILRVFSSTSHFGSSFTS